MHNHAKIQWLGLWGRLGARGDPEKIFNELVAHYSESHRFYHILKHIEHCLRELDKVRHFIRNVNTVELALWWHDSAYDTRAKDNEEKSILLMAEAMRQVCVAEKVIEISSTFIMLSKHRVPPIGLDARFSIDIDLAILGQTEERFDEYERQIRKEYEWVSDADFVRGRSAILDSFLKRPAIYSTPFFHQIYEEQARKNLSRSLAQLSGRS